MKNAYLPMESWVPKPEDLHRVLLDRGSPSERWVWRTDKDRFSSIHHPSMPAVEWKNGRWIWYWMNQKHRWDGPAMFWDGKFSYWIHGKLLDREE